MVCVVAIASMVTSVVQVVTIATRLSLSYDCQPVSCRQHQQVNVQAGPVVGSTTPSPSSSDSAAEPLNGTSPVGLVMTDKSYILLTVMAGLDFAMIVTALLTTTHTRSTWNSFYRLLPWIVYLYVYISWETVLLTCCWLPLLLPETQRSPTIKTVSSLFGNRDASLAYWSLKIAFDVVGSVWLLLRMAQLSVSSSDYLMRDDDEILEPSDLSVASHSCLSVTSSRQKHAPSTQFADIEDF